MTNLQNIQDLHKQILREPYKTISYDKALKMLSKAKESKSFTERYRLLTEVLMNTNNVESIKNELLSFRSLLLLVKKINKPNSSMVSNSELQTLFEQATQQLNS